jgi:hypothetical protein
MGVTRYRDSADLPEPARTGSALEGLAAACAASSWSQAFGNVRRAPRGVLRFRSIEEADAHRQRWESTPADTGDTGGSPASQRSGPRPQA